MNSHKKMSFGLAKKDLSVKEFSPFHDAQYDERHSANKRYPDNDFYSVVSDYPSDSFHMKSPNRSVMNMRVSDLS